MTTVANMTTMSDQLIQVDEVEIEVLEESINKVQALSNQISVSLNKLSVEAKYAERDIRPISGRAKRDALYARSMSSTHTTQCCTLIIPSWYVCLNVIALTRPLFKSVDY